MPPGSDRVLSSSLPCILHSIPKAALQGGGREQGLGGPLQIVLLFCLKGYRPS